MRRTTKPGEEQEEEIAGATAPRHTWVSVNRKGTSVSGAGEQRGGGGDEAT